MSSLIAIVCMVKNEAEKIHDTLLPFIKYGFKNILVNDTGSEDNTCDKIRSLSKDIIIGHSIFSGYSNSRNLTLEMAKETFEEAKFILMIDCEWYVKNLDSLVKFCNDNIDSTDDCFNIKIYIDGVMNLLPCLIRIDSNCKYEGDLHEIFKGKCTMTVPDLRIDVIQTKYGIEKTCKRNIEFDIPYYLSKENRTDEDTFFLAQSYHNVKDYDNAIKYYNELIFDRKKYQYIAHYRIGEIAFLNKIYEMAIEQYLGAILQDHKRCEPYVRLAQILQFSHKYDFAKMALSKDIPTENVLFLESDCYDYYKYLEFAKGCLNVKRYKEGLSVIGKYMENNKELNYEMKTLKELLSRKIVILILTSPGYEEYNKIMESYLSNFDLEFFFYSFSEEYSELKIDGHHIFIPGKETFIPGILQKTIDVFKLFSNYDYILRLNATTFIDLTKVSFGNESLSEEVKLNYDYYGYLNSVSLDENPEYGVTKEFLEKHGSFPFVSGKCIILSKKAVNEFLTSNINYDVMDDISIALSLKSFYTVGNKNSFSEEVNNISVITICSSVEIMQNAVDNFYSDNNYLKE